MALLRSYFIAGLLIWLPVGVTLLAIKFIVSLMDKTLLLLPEPYHPDLMIGMHIPGLGLLLALIVLLLTGVAAVHLAGRWLAGRWLIELGESIVRRVPVVRSIYAATKQVTEAVLSSGAKSFRRVVMIEYPRQGIWTLAFVSGDTPEEMQKQTGQELVNVFVPTTPNPTSGFMLIIPREDIIDVDVSLEEGFKMILSAGAIAPRQRLAK